MPQVTISLTLVALKFVINEAYHSSSLSFHPDTAHGYKPHKSHSSLHEQAKFQSMPSQNLLHVEWYSLCDETMPVSFPLRSA